MPPSLPERKRSRLILLALLLALLAIGGLTACGSDDDDKGGDEASESSGSEDEEESDEDGVVADEGDFVIELVPGEGDDEGAEDTLAEIGIEDIASGLNENFSLPQDIPIIFRSAVEEGEGPFFDPAEGSITIPYSFFTETLAVFQEVGERDEEAAFESTLNTVQFVIYHEVGHALTDILELPITGREEDAVDGLAAAFVTLAIEDGSDVVLDAADWFNLNAEATGGFENASIETFADEHSLDEQRFFNLVCWVYGSDPEAYSGIVENGFLPEDRAVRCPDEYEQNVTSWVTLLDANLKE